MGAYCRYCNHRCFVLRVLRDGRTICLATCDKGMAWDYKVCGQTHRTALNPHTMRRDVTPDARRVPLGVGVTLTARITGAVVDQLIAADRLTALAVQTLAGVPETYDVATRGRLYTFTG